MQNTACSASEFQLGLCSLLLGLSELVSAQTRPTTAPATAVAAADELITMDFPADGVELSVLADVVTRELHIPILYDEQVKGKRVIIRVPIKVPERALMGILQSALRLKQLALVDAEEPGWKQIVPAEIWPESQRPGSWRAKVRLPRCSFSSKAIRQRSPRSSAPSSANPAGLSGRPDAESAHRQRLRKRRSSRGVVDRSARCAIACG